MSGQPAKEERKPRLHHGIGAILGLALGLGILLVSIGFAPWAVMSAFREVVTNSSDTYVVQLTKGQPNAPGYTRLAVKLLEIDEVADVVTVRVSGFHSCHEECGKYKDRLVLASFGRHPETKDIQPDTVSIPIPNDAEEINAKVDLPLTGRIMNFPFDTYEIAMGLAIERTPTGGESEFLKPGDNAANLALSFDEDVPRLAATPIKVLDPVASSPSRAPFKYIYAFQTELFRPLYVKYTVVLMTVLIMIASLYTAMLHQFSQLVLTTGATIFGVWSARTLLIGGYPPDVTILDLCFAVTVILVLLATAARSLGYFWDNHRTYRAAVGRRKEGVAPLTGPEITE